MNDNLSLRAGTAHAVTSEAADAEAAPFDLRDLAPPARAAYGGQAGAPHPAKPFDDPFGVLDIAGARLQPTAGPLAGWLGEVPRRAAATPSRIPEPAGRVSLRRPVHALLDGLHEEFIRVVRDPGQLAGSTGRSDAVASGGEHAPTLEALSRHAQTFPLLRGILHAREPIDRIIESFDAPGRATLLDREPAEDVLGLFAPEPRRGAAPVVATLSRREHHALSLDSHMSMAHARPAGADTEPEGHHEDAR